MSKFQFFFIKSTRKFTHNTFNFGEFYCLIISGNLRNDWTNYDDTFIEIG